jgi:deoxyuridine 5''-triphosphate nucleotidohydrolase (dut)
MKIKKLTKTAIIPTRGSNGAAGYDLYADSVEVSRDSGVAVDTDDNTKQTNVYISENAKCVVHTGIAMAIPEGYVGLIFARSGLACKQGLRPSNCVGVIDEDYRGEIIVNLHNDPITNSPAITKFAIGDRVAQIVFVKYNTFDFEITDNLDETTRGTGGFGSTGKN